MSSDPFGDFNNQKIKEDRINSDQRSSSFVEDFFHFPSWPKSPGFLGISLSGKRINIIFIIVIFFILIILGRAIQLQILHGDYYESIAEGNRIRIIRKPAMRGVIYDRQKKILAENVPDWQLAIIPVDLPKEKKERLKIIIWLSELTGKKEEVIEQLISSQSPFSYEPLVILDDIDYNQALKLEVETAKLQGVKLLVESQRHYLATESDPSLSHILGYLGKISPEEKERFLSLGYHPEDLVGKNGLERYYERVLKGKDGREKIEVDAYGNQKEIISMEASIPGSSLVLTIDSDLQQVAKNALARTLRAYNKKRGVVVVLDPNSGEVLSLVSLPTYNNNDFVSGISQKKLEELTQNTDQPLFNRAVAGQYPSGSTVKPIVAVAALEEGIINSRTKILSQGGLRVDQWFFPDWKKGGHGWTDVKKALAESVNTFFYQIAGGFQDFEGLGLERLTNYFKLFGLGTKLGLDLPNEASGFIPSADWKKEVKGEPWYIGDTYHLSIGQGDILVTPLQVASWTSFFANYGTLYQPYLVSDIIDATGQIVKSIKPKVIRQDFVEEKNVSLVRDGLRQVVTQGSAKGLLNLPITSAGKTGTAQWSKDKPPHAWFTGFAPYEKAEIVVTVLIEEGGEGSRVALPIASDIFSWWAANR